MMDKIDSTGIGDFGQAQLSAPEAARVAAALSRFR
jgi:hypothetical protein